MELRVGIIGIGGAGYLQAKTYAEMENVFVLAGADVSSEARSLFENEFHAPAYEHYRELLHEHAADLDAMSIVTPHTLHFEQAMAAVKRDLHVLVEKPMVTEIGHAVELIETAADRELVLEVGYQRHLHPAFREIRRVLQSGRIGDVHSLTCHLGQDWIDLHRDTWRTDPALSGGGQLWDTGSHLLDAVLWTTGTKPATVAAQIEFDRPQIDVNSALAVELERDDNQIIGSVGISGNGVEPVPSEGYFYWGTNGRLSYTDGRISVAEKDAVTYSTAIDGGIDYQTLNRRKLENFIASIHGESEPIVPGEFGLQVTALTVAAYRAARSEHHVTVQPLIHDAHANLE